MMTKYKTYPLRALVVGILSGIISFIPLYADNMNTLVCVGFPIYFAFLFGLIFYYDNDFYNNRGWRNKDD